MRSHACASAGIVTAVAMFCALSAGSVLAHSTDVDLEMSDGVMLKATYMSPDQPGPAMLLIHQCNMDRTSWDGIAAQLVEAGVHVMTLDLRGFGDSGGEGMSAGFPNLLAKSHGDLDAAYAYLLDQEGVDGSRVAVGGASCGAMLTADLAGRQAGITSLMLLSGPPSDDAIASIAANTDLAVFGAAAVDDPVTPGVADTIQRAVDGSENTHSMAKVYAGTEHGLPMFAKNPDLEPVLVAWLKERLLATGH
jgi:dienelactone hydrolase